MTEFELVYLFNETVNSLQTSFMNYVAVLFAFLIGAYLVADKLETRIVVVVIALFTVVTLQQATPIFGHGYDVAAIATQVAMDASDASSAIRWHSAAQPWGTGIIPTFRFGTMVILVLSYIGAIIFFFQQRHAGRAQ